MSTHLKSIALLGAFLWSSNGFAQDVVRDLRSGQYILKSGVPTPCQFDCRVPVNVTRASNDCAANVPADVMVGGKGKRYITWELDQTSIDDQILGKAVYEFDAKNGILVIDDVNKQITGHGHIGSRTDGTDKSRFTIWHANAHNEGIGKAPAPSVYLPIVLQKVTDPKSKEETLTLCEAKDPRIVNN